MNEKECLDCIAKHSNEIVGIKIRLVAQISNNGKNEIEAFKYVKQENVSKYVKHVMFADRSLITICNFRRSLSIATKSKLPLMIHHSFSTIPVSSEGLLNY